MTRLVFPVLLALGWAGAATAQQTHWSQVAGGIAAEIAKAEAQALAQQPSEAKKTVTGAYFGRFETSKMEAALRKEIGSKHAFHREQLFGDLRKAIDKGAADDVKAVSAALRAGLAEDGKALDKAGVSPEVFQVNQ